MPITVAAPVLMRSPGVVQVGLDPALCFSGDLHDIEMLRLLDGTRSLTKTALHSGVSMARIVTVVAALLEAGLAKESRTPLRLACYFTGTIGNATHELFQQSAHRFQLLDRHCTLTTSARADVEKADLVVVAVDDAVVPLDVLALLERIPRPAVTALGTQDGARVGPWTIPGNGVCLHCCARVGNDDAAWPGLIAQLDHRSLTVRPAAASWAAGLLLNSIDEVAGHGASTSLYGQSWELGRQGILARPWFPHPDCSCQLDRLLCTSSTAIAA